jgi:hypothetical protein
LGLADAASLCDTRLLRVGGHGLLLHHDEVADPNTLRARLDVGLAPAEQQDWLWHRLLLTNFEWGGHGTLGWSLTPEDTRVILTVSRAVDGQTDGAELATWLRQVVACAEAYWTALRSGRPVAEIGALLPLIHAARHTSSAASDRRTLVSLIEDFCDHVGFPERQQLLDNGLLEADGVNMQLHASNASGRFEVRTDLGICAELEREKLWRGLLWNNFFHALKDRTLFSVYPGHDHDHVVLAQQQDISAEMGAEALADLLHAAARNAKCFWEQVHAEIARTSAA